MLRTEKGLSQKDVAEKLDIYFTTYGDYERGDAMPPADNLRVLANVFQVSIDYLLDGEKEDAIIADLKDRELLSLFQEVEKFDDEEQKHIKYLIKSAVKSKKHDTVSTL